MINTGQKVHGIKVSPIRAGGAEGKNLMFSQGNNFRRKTFKGENIHEFRGFGATRKRFSPRNLGVPIPTYDRLYHSMKIFSAKWSPLTDPQKFSPHPSKVSHYTV